jgi:hypothetical protein
MKILLRGACPMPPAAVASPTAVVGGEAGDEIVEAGAHLVHTDLLYLSCD